MVCAIEVEGDQLLDLYGPADFVPVERSPEPVTLFKTLKHLEVLENVWPNALDTEKPLIYFIDIVLV